MATEAARRAARAIVKDLHNPADIDEEAWVQKYADIIDRERGVVRLPEPEGWLVRCVIETLRKWYAAQRSGLFHLAEMDIDQLEEWSANLLDQWKQSDMSLNRSGLVVEVYPPKPCR